MKLVIGAATLALCIASTAYAQEAPSEPIRAVAAAAAPVQGTMASLPANTEILLRMNEEISTKQNDEGDTFYLTLVHDVLLNGFVVIPRGARATGEVKWKTGKGAFGKSGKLEIEIKYLEVGGRRVPLVGTFRQEGEGNTVATVAAVALVWVAAPFITGKTGRIPAGRELTVHTRDALDVVLPKMAQAAPDAVVTQPPAEPAAPAAPPATAATAQN